MPVHWFILRVGTGREDKIQRHIWHRAQTQNLTHLLPELLVLKERVTDIKDGKKRSRKQKVYPGYIMAQIDVDEEGEVPTDVWHLIRETPGQVKFVGPQNEPTPMSPDEVEKMMAQKEKINEAPEQVTVDYKKGDRVRIKEGSFENFKGEVDDVNNDKGQVSVSILVFGRPTRIDFEYWKVEKAIEE
ncbi:MAG: transcription termination/antitermination protein NusG [Planctomycetota bacterium]|nr:transcription termination/antitermination protein NusG [Planctomycetota bacterium]